MDDQSLDNYLENVVDDLKKAEYSNDDIKKALDKVVVSRRNRKFFLSEYYFYSLIIGVIFAALAIAVSTLFSEPTVFYVLLIILFASLAYLLYFEFKYFDFQDKNILAITLSISAIVCVFAYLMHRIVNNKISQVIWESTRYNPLITDLTFYYPINIYGLVILILITYNILPVIVMIRDRNKGVYIDERFRK